MNPDRAGHDQFAQHLVVQLLEPLQLHVNQGLHAAVAVRLLQLPASHVVSPACPRQRPLARVRLLQQQVGGSRARPRAPVRALVQTSVLAVHDAELLCPPVVRAVPEAHRVALVHPTTL